MSWFQNKYIAYALSIMILFGILPGSSTAYADTPPRTPSATTAPGSAEEALDRRVDITVYVDFTGLASSYPREEVWVVLYSSNYGYTDSVLLEAGNEWRHVFSDLPAYAVPSTSYPTMYEGLSLASPSDAFYAIRWLVQSMDGLNRYRVYFVDEYTWVLRPEGYPLPTPAPSSSPGAEPAPIQPEGPTSQAPADTVPEPSAPSTDSAQPTRPPQPLVTAEAPVNTLGGGGAFGGLQSHTDRPGQTDGTVSVRREEMDAREKERLEAQLSFSIENDLPREQVPGTEHVFSYLLQNNGEAAAEGIYIRAYMPTYMQFVSADSRGDYGFIDGREHVTWYIERLEAGEAVEIGYRAAFGYCIAGQVTSEIRYEVLGAGPKPYANRRQDPAKIVQ